MAKFKNNKTGNILIVNNEKTIALMTRSDQYTRVPEQPEAEKTAKKSARNARK